MPVSLLLLFLFAENGTLLAQDNWWKDKKYKSESQKTKFEMCKKTFIEIGSGLSYGNINSIRPHFSSIIYLDVFGSEKGFYNESQAEIILSNFFENFPVEKFSYRSSTKYNNFASAKGGYEFRSGNISSSFQANVILKYKNRVWHVDQIIIN